MTSEKLSPEDPIRIYYYTPAPWMDDPKVYVGASYKVNGGVYDDKAPLSPLVVNGHNRRYDLELIEKRLRHRVAGASLGLIPLATD